MGVFFFRAGLALIATMSASGIEEGRCGLRLLADRYELLMCAGEKPLTTLVVLRSEVQLDSDDGACMELTDAESEERDSTMRWGDAADVAGASGDSGVCWVSGVSSFSSLDDAR